ncbi:hypothetical protein T484DRAFT_1753722 [Baffinella frigidus]|nr:hypothetical protein T484DRAFT_1753722 [Cryptophyta sp. CCMP2293]
MALAAHSGALRLALGAVLVHLSSCATTTPRSAFVALRALGVAPRHAAISRGTSIGSRMAIGETFDKRPTNGKTDRIKNLLTQRAVQTQLYTLSFSGDLNTFEFLECFKDHHGLCDLHDHGALKVGWKEYLFDLIQTYTPKPWTLDPERDECMSFTGRSRSGGRPLTPPPFVPMYRGWTRTVLVQPCILDPHPQHPFLQDAAVSMEFTTTTTPHFTIRHPVSGDAAVSMEFTTTIRPAILADNIMALRQDIAVEWLSDLKLVAAENDELMRQHLAMVTEMEDPAGKLMYSSLQLDDSSTPLRKSNYDLLPPPPTEGLLRETPKVVRGTLRDADEVTLVDPLDIAARIMAERQVLADKWVKALEDIEDDHLSIRRAIVESCFAVSLASFLPIIPMADPHD